MEVWTERSCLDLEQVKYIFNVQDVARILEAHVKSEYSDYILGGKRCWAFEWRDDGEGRLIVELVQDREVLDGREVIGKFVV